MTTNASHCVAIQFELGGKHTIKNVCICGIVGDFDYMRCNQITEMGNLGSIAAVSYMRE